MPKLSERQFYCVACRKIRTRPVDDICFHVYHNSVRRDAPALRSVCAVCETNLTKFVSDKAEGRLERKYAKCSAKKGKKAHGRSKRR